jgi:hypothetical protein
VDAVNVKYLVRRCRLLMLQGKEHLLSEKSGVLEGYYMGWFLCVVRIKISCIKLAKVSIAIIVILNIFTKNYS